MRNEWLAIALALLCTIAIGAWVARWTLGYSFEEPSIQSQYPDAMYKEYETLLTQYAGPHGVDYKSLSQTMLLERVYGYFAHQGPRTSPAKFPTDADRLAYDINAYNALIRIVISRHWPLESPLDIHGAVEPTEGFGLLQARRFLLDGKKTSLIQLDHHMQDNPAWDPRVRLVLACGGHSCPYVQAPVFRGENLDTQLDDAIQRMLATGRAITIDDEHKQILVLSVVMFNKAALGEWAESQEPPQTFQQWLVSMSPKALDLADLLQQGYTLQPMALDWSVDYAAKHLR